MKKKITLIFFTSIIIISGCKKGIEEKVFGRYAKLTNYNEINAATIGIYQSFAASAGGFQWQLSLFTMAETGHRYSTYGTHGDGQSNTPFLDYNYNDRTAELARTWQNLYRVVNRSNVVIEAAEKVLTDPAQSEPIIAEARFMRGWAYFVLTQFWGPVPLQLSAIDDNSNRKDFLLPRSPIKDVYDIIVSDLSYASEFLPKKRTDANLGRVTSASARGMLGKVYLTMAGKPLNDNTCYKKAIDVLSPLILNSDEYNVALLEVNPLRSLTYSRIFSENNEMNSEVLFAIRLWATLTDGTNGSTLTRFLPPPQSNFASQSTQNLQAYGLRWEILRLFERNDVRTFDGIGGRYPSTSLFINGQPDTLVYDTISKFTVTRKSNGAVVAPAAGNDGYGIGYTKWKAETPTVTASPLGNNKDYIILRYADVLLCYAEALNEDNQTALATTYLNQVRFRAKARALGTVTPLTKLECKTYIRSERVRELVGEFTTIFDIRRWGTLEDEMNGYKIGNLKNKLSPVPTFNPKFYLYPIPQSEIALNTSLLPNNPGW